MGLLGFLKDAFSDHKGPVYTVEDLERCWKDYKGHAIAAYEAIAKAVSGVPLQRIYNASRPGEPGEGLARARYTYLSTAEGWVEREFIAKIKKYRRKVNNAGQPTAYCRTFRSVSYDDRPLVTARNHLHNLRMQSEQILSVLTFFLCDARSPFDMKAGLDNGECSCMDIARWYVGGKNIVAANMKRIEDGLSGYLEWLKKEGSL